MFQENFITTETCIIFSPPSTPLYYIYITSSHIRPPPPNWLHLTPTSPFHCFYSVLSNLSVESNIYSSVEPNWYLLLGHTVMANRGLIFLWAVFSGTTWFSKSESSFSRGRLDFSRMELFYFSGMTWLSRVEYSYFSGTSWFFRVDIFWAKLWMANRDLIFFCAVFSGTTWFSKSESFFFSGTTWISRVDLE